MEKRSTYEMRASVDLASGGVVGITVNCDLINASADDRTFVFELVDRLKAYEAKVTALRVAPYGPADGDRS